MACLSVAFSLLVFFYSSTRCGCTQQQGLSDILDLWDSVVSKHVQPGNLQGISLNVVNYTGISKDGNYSAFIDAIATVNTSGFDRDTVYAFFMNVYNALAIKMIIDHPCSSACHPIKGIKDIGSLFHPVWSKPAGTVAGKEWTLNQVENYLRDPSPLKEDSRLHACIVCASISCPNVRREAFRPERVGQQMDDQLQQFLANPKKGSLLDKASKTLHLSPIFLWFAGDFEAYGGVTKFVSSYLPSEEAQYIAQNNPTIEYFSYNWDANGTPPCAC